MERSNDCEALGRQAFEQDEDLQRVPRVERAHWLIQQEHARAQGGVREIELGLANSTHGEVKKGLGGGEVLVLAPRVPNGRPAASK